MAGIGVVFTRGIITTIAGTTTIMIIDTTPLWVWGWCSVRLATIRLFGFAPYAEYGTSDSLAAEVQNALSRRGYDSGGVSDGVIGPQTRNAVLSAFQEDNGMPVTGRIDQRLVRSLGL